MNVEKPFTERKVVMLSSRRTLVSLTLALAIFVPVIAASVASGGTLERASVARAEAGVGTSTAAARCKKVGTGQPWKHGGRSGTVYTIEGDKASSCTLGIAWLKRITNYLNTKNPAGWGCTTASATETGVCYSFKNAKTAFTWTYGRT
jgi:hypothetical protein